MFVEVILIELLSISIIFNIYQYYKIKKTKTQLKNLGSVLYDIQEGNGNRRILADKSDLTSELAYKINEIVLQYEKEISNLNLNNEAYKELMTSLSHDVRTPLTTLIGYMDAINRGVVSGEEEEEYFHIARLKAYDLKEYIDVLFEWFKLQSNEIDIVIGKIEITELTRLILKDWIPVIEEHEMEFEIEIPDTPIYINIDKAIFNRIMNNLMQNVMNHSKATKVKINIETKEDRAIICVEDNGIGIDEKDLTHIFERLYKVDRGRSQKGSGLGLAIVKEMVEKMDGKIKVESLKDKCTQFTMTFPIY